MGRIVDLVDDVGLNVSRTPIRNSLAGGGAFLAVAIFVFSISATTTSAAEVASSFDRLAATSVEFVSAQPDRDPILGADFEAGRLKALPGVVGAGAKWGLGEVNVHPGTGHWIAERGRIEATAIDLEAMELLELSIHGTTLSKADHELGRPVVLIGAAASRTFSYDLVPGMTILIDGQRFQVAGIVTDAKRGANALVEVLVPATTAARIWPARKASATVTVEVIVGSAGTIASEGALVINPNHPERVLALYDPEAAELRRTVTTQVDGIAVLVGVGLLITGAFGIAGSMVASVSERRHEIGIRRALGARRGQIIQLILGEAALIGIVASLAGLAAGLAAFLAVAISRGWSPVLPPEVLVIAPLTGIVAGLVAGSLPAVYASRIEPAEALRS